MPTESSNTSKNQLEAHPKIPEGINVSDTHPLADFGYMVAGVVALLAVIVVISQLLAGYLVRYIPYEYEEALFQQAFADEFLVSENLSEYSEQQDYIQEIADKLVPHMDLPEGMRITAHYDPSSIPNAYATLGGNIFIYQGLIDEVSSENGLAMVVAHEIAHIKNRHPIMSLGRGVVTAIAIGLITGLTDVGGVVNLTGTSLLMKFSRDQENAADQDALDAVMKAYGHLAGADEFFLAAMDRSHLADWEIFSTHPATEDRIERIQSQAANAQGTLTALPEVLMQAQSVEAEPDENNTGLVPE